MNKQNPIKEVNEWMKEKFPNGYIVSGNYEGYKDAFINGYKKANKEFAEVLGEEIKVLQVLCMSGGINKVAMKEVFRIIEHLKQLKKEYEESLK